MPQFFDMPLAAALIWASVLAVVAPAHGEDRLTAAEMSTFARDFGSREGFDPETLHSILSAARIQPQILAAIARPAEAKPWWQYRSIFINDVRIAAGVSFWREHREALARAEAQYGVPAQVIVAVIGVETLFGRNAGRHRVLDALATLGFRYPPRAAFFRRELEHFLLLARDQGVDAQSLLGSYAGAMGLPQFMPSSYRSYAVDFDADSRIDIWSDPDDAIGSVGNYLARHGWRREAPIAAVARLTAPEAAALASRRLEATESISRLRAAGVESADGLAIAPDSRASLLEYALESGQEYWLGFDNFFVITRYNRSTLYALAVFQLAERIKTDFHAQ
ncbi:MAG: lytic murein transglycosylase B [Gammaproteobacteria bacterium]